MMVRYDDIKRKLVWQSGSSVGLMIDFPTQDGGHS